MTYSWLVLWLATTAPGLPERDDALGSYDDPDTIVGGSLVEPCAWPGVVWLPSTRCSGTLIHPQVVLSAGHCGEATGEVVFGEEADAPRRTARIDWCRVFPVDQNPHGDEEFAFFGRDFSVCRLEEPVLDLPIASPVLGCELSAIDQAVSTAAEATVVGFGADETGLWGLKHEVAVPILERTAKDELFLGGLGRDACDADSGGPAFLQIAGHWRVLGIVSYAIIRENGPACGDGGFYSLAHNAVEWVESVADVDVTPCSSPGEPMGADGRCRAGLSSPRGGGSWQDGCQITTDEPTESCGDSSNPLEPGGRPVIRLTSANLDRDTDVATLDIRLDVVDPTTWGIQYVVMEGDGVQSRWDWSPPYRFVVDLPSTEEISLDVTAVSWEGESSETVHYAPRSREGCSIQAWQPQADRAVGLLWIVSMAAIRRTTSRSSRRCGTSRRSR